MAPRQTTRVYATHGKTSSSALITGAMEMVSVAGSTGIARKGTCVSRKSVCQNVCTCGKQIEWWRVDGSSWLGDGEGLMNLRVGRQTRLGIWSGENLVYVVTK